MAEQWIMETRWKFGSYLEEDVVSGFPNFRIPNLCLPWGFLPQFRLPQGCHHYCLIGCVTPNDLFFFPPFFSPEDYYFHRGVIVRTRRKGRRQLPFSINDTQRIDTRLLFSPASRYDWHFDDTSLQRLILLFKE